MMHHYPPPHFGERHGLHAPPRMGDQFDNMQSRTEILRINMNNHGHCFNKHMKRFHKKMHKNFSPYFSPTERNQIPPFDKTVQKKEDKYLVKLEKKAKKLQKKMDKLEQKRQKHLVLLGLQLDKQEEAGHGNIQESSQSGNNDESQETPQREDIAVPVEAN